MAKSIEVCKQSVIELLKTSRKNVFVIPEYQRPYAWTEDEVIDEYESAYERKSANPAFAPTEEQKKQIAPFKERGWI